MKFCCPSLSPPKPLLKERLGGPQYCGILIVAADARRARYVGAVGEERRVAHRVAAVLRAQRAVQRLVEGVAPAQVEIDSLGVVAVHELEEVGVVRAGALIAQTAVQRIALVEHFVDARLQGVRIGSSHQRDLVVVARRRSEVGLRIEVQQRLGLRRDARCRNHITGERRAGGGVDELHGLAQRVQGLRKIAAALRGGRHQAGLRIVGVAIARPLVGHEEISVVGVEEVRDTQRPAEGEPVSHVIVSRLGNILAGDGEDARIERRVVHNRADVAAVPGAGPFAEVADCAPFHAVADAAVHQQGVAIGCRSGFIDATGCGLVRGGRRACRKRSNRRAENRAARWP